MTEAEWLACEDPDPMLVHTKGAISERKYRLFAVACCRRVWHLIADERSRRLVEVVEWHIEGDAAEGLWEAVTAVANQAWEDTSALVMPSFFGRPSLGFSPPSGVSAEVLHATTTAARELGYRVIRSALGQEGRAVAHSVARETARAVANDYTASPERPHQSDLLRDIIGNPFRRPADMVDWLTATVAGLAHTIYADRAFDRLPILADALEDAGCDDEEILSHCRGPGPHVRGCWVVDLILGKS